MALQTPLWAASGTYPPELDRAAVIGTMAGLPGVASLADLRVEPRAQGANMSVDITPGVAAVEGGYLVRSTARENRPIAAAPGSGTRVDSVIARVTDPASTGVGDELGWSIDVVSGPPGGGFPTLPALSLELARVTVPAGTVSITSGRIQDRRCLFSARPLSSSSLPQRGWPGQVVGRDDGTLWVWDASGWVELARLRDFWAATTSRETAQNVGTSAVTVRSTTRQLPAARRVTVEGTLAVSFASSSNNAVLATFWVEILVGGSVVASSPRMTALSGNTLDGASVTVPLNWSGNAEGTVEVRGRGATINRTAQVTRSTLTASVRPD